MSLLTEWNLDDALAVQREEGWEEGWEKGWEDGLEEGRKKGWEKGRQEAIAKYQEQIRQMEAEIRQLRGVQDVALSRRDGEDAL
ncbi:MAG: hypothetical protein LBP20_00910, partial [Treponema sp.]|nr:hypothetical protein [Treponema sp.]